MRAPLLLPHLLLLSLACTGEAPGPDAGASAPLRLEVTQPAVDAWTSGPSVWVRGRAVGAERVEVQGAEVAIDAGYFAVQVPTPATGPWTLRVEATGPAGSSVTVTRALRQVVDAPPPDAGAVAPDASVANDAGLAGREPPPLASQTPSTPDFEAPPPIPGDIDVPTLRIDAPTRRAVVPGPSVEVRGAVEGTAPLSVTVDGAPGRLDDEGAFRARIAPAPGPHVVRVEVIDARGLRARAEIPIYVGAVDEDLTPPTLIVDQPQRDAILYADDLAVSGRVTDAESGPLEVLVNGQPARIEGDAFALRLEVPPGDGVLEVEATDWAANSARLEVPYTRRPSTEGGEIRLVDAVEEAFGDDPPAATGDTAGIGLGAAAIDIDGDGDLDLVAGGTDQLIYNPRGPGRAFENLGVVDGHVRFAEWPGALQPSLDGRAAYAFAVGDYDGDGDDDLFVAGEGGDLLYRNDGGVLIEVGEVAGVTGDLGRSAGAMFADFDRDGLDDLYVPGFSTEVAAQRSHPRDDPLAPHPALYLNNGDGTFRDVTEASGLRAVSASTHAALVFDLDGDGWLDIYDANDVFASGPPDQLWLQAPPGPDGAVRFTNATEAWAVDERTYRMGLALGDPQNDLRPDLYITDIEPNRLYPLWEGPPLVDTAVALGITNATIPDPVQPQRLINLWSWGALFVDLDRDGFQDLFVANGAISPLFERVTYFQLPYVFHNERGEAFTDANEAIGLPHQAPFNEALARELWARGVVAADYDGDGDLDFLLSTLFGPFHYLRNDSIPAGRAVRIRLRGSLSGPAAVGARVRVTADAWTHAGFVYAGGNTRSVAEQVVEVPIGRARRIDGVWVDWPSGWTQHIPTPTLEEVDAGTLSIEEPRWLEWPRYAEAGGAVELRLLPPTEGAWTLHAGGAPLPLRPSGDALVATLPPHEAGRVVVEVRLDDEPLPVRPWVLYR